MSKITKIFYPPNKPERVYVYIDNEYCSSLRARTFQAMGLNVGDEITCAVLKEKENFFWKQSYQGIWKNEKVRIEKVANLIQGIDENAFVKIVGFGADSEVLIKEHPEEKGKPDIDITHKMKQDIVLLKIEVTGTESMRGTDYWVRPDKLEYAENHPEEDVWIILHFSEPKEIFIFIQPIRSKKYKRHEKNIRGAGEIFCIFNDGDEDVKTLAEFSEHLKKKLNEVRI